MSAPEPEIPEGAEYLLALFWDLGHGRSAGFDGPAPLSSTETMHWIALTGNVLTRHEIGLLRTMDAALLDAVVKERDEAAKKRQRGRR